MKSFNVSLSSLCYDFQKWTMITMLGILTVCLVGMVNLAFGQTENKTDLAMQEANKIIGAASYIDDPSTPWNETANPERVEAEYEKKQLEQEIKQTMKTQLEFVLNYCYEHADRPDPVQDLRNQGLLPEYGWDKETCKSTKQNYDSLVSQGY